MNYVLDLVICPRNFCVNLNSSSTYIKLKRRKKKNKMKAFAFLVEKNNGNIYLRSHILSVGIIYKLMNRERIEICFTVITQFQFERINPVRQNVCSVSSKLVQGAR